MSTDVSSLDVYQRAFKISLDMHDALKSFPHNEQYRLVDQMMRASRSVCANLAEGYAQRKFSIPQYKRFIMMSIGSAAEMRVWIDYGHNFGYFSSEQTKTWKQEYTEIENMLSGLARKAQ